jgi:hypothetical protein
VVLLNVEKILRLRDKRLTVGMDLKECADKHAYISLQVTAKITEEVLSPNRRVNEDDLSEFGSNDSFVMENGDKINYVTRD